MTPIEKDKLEILCKKWNLSELKISKGIYMADDNSGITVNLRGDMPLVGVTIAGTFQTEGHGILKVADIQTEADLIMKSKTIPTSKSSVTDLSAPPKAEAKGSNPASGGIDKGTQSRQMSEPTKPIPSETKLGAGDTPPGKKGTTKATCPDCKTIFEISLDEARTLYDKYGGVYCMTCRDKPAETKHDEKEHQEAQKGKDAQAEKREARPEESKVAVIPRPDALIPIKTYIPQGSIIKGFVPSLKEIGKIKIGRKSNKTTASGHRLPEKIDHFEVVGLMRDEQGDFIPDPIMRTLGESPKELNIFLLYNDLTLNFPTRYNAYKGGKCLCRGDGEKATTINGDEIPCNPETCSTFKDKGCKVNGILSCVLADSPTLGGVYKLRTGSFYSVRSILSSLMYISTLTGGILSMIPLKLTVTPMQVTPNGQNQTVYIVNVIFPGTMQNLLEATVKVSQYQLGMRTQIQQLEATAKLALAQPESEEDQREYQEEFMPEKDAKQ